MLMPQDKIFFTALIASLAAHIIIIAGLPIMPLYSKAKKISQKIEVTYKKAVFQPKLIDTEPKKTVKINTIKNKIAFDKRIPPQFSDFMAKKNNDHEIIRKPIILGDKPAASGTIKALMPQIKPEFLSLGAELPKNPAYLKYYQGIRDKIQHYANNYRTQETGEVDLSFVIASDGRLKNLRVIEEKSSPNNHLKDIALSSIQEASPFSAIPAELNYPELSFSIIVVFERN